MAADNRVPGVFLVGFGGPESLEEVPAFVKSVLHRPPPDHVLSTVSHRYKAIGGGSPLPDTTRDQASLLAKELYRRGREVKVYVGMLHARPTIEEAAEKIMVDGVTDLSVISLAPYRCEVSTDAYEAAAQNALEASGVSIRLANDWNLEPSYIGALASMLSEALAHAPHEIPVIFSAHSLPQRMIDQGDPYVDQLQTTAAQVAERVGAEWRLAYQSVSGAASEPWLLPSVEEVMDEMAADGASAVLVDPIGFIADHVETLYDNDVEHRAHAENLGLAFHRCRCLNSHPGLIGALADVAIATADSG